MNDFKTIYEQHIGALDKAFMDQNWSNKSFYARYLAQTYYYICHSAKLLKLAAENSPTEKLKSFLMHHASEEKGHEHWASGDLKKLGFELKDFPEQDVTKALYQDIYDGIKRDGPAAIVGYAMALEGMSARVCPKLTPLLLEKYGAKCASFIKNHGEKDPGHTEDSFDFLDYFSDQEKETIVRYMKLTTDTYMKFLKNVATDKRLAA